MFRIRAVSELTGLSPTLIRAWERRYGFLRPARTSTQYRLYTQRDVDLLRAARQLIGAGRSIGQVARMPPDELLAAGASPPPASGDGAGDGADRRVIDAAAAAVAAFDRERFEAALLQALATLSPLDLCRRVLLPLLREIGDRWHAGRLSIAQEHFGSALVRNRIVHLMENMPRRSGGCRVVCACPDGELHEGALLAFAVHAAARGWEVIYLGASTPDLELLATVEQTGAAVLALSITADGDAHKLRGLVALIRGRRARGLKVRVVAGGRGALAHRSLLEAGAIDVAEDVALDLGLLASGGA